MTSRSEDKRQLKEVASSSQDLSESLTFLAGRFERAERQGTALGRRQSGARPAKRGSGGRPTRAQTSGDLANEAPFLELMTLPAPKLYQKIREISSPALLRAAHRFEAEHLRRKTVFSWIEELLRQLGEPLGGPAEPPFANFDTFEQGALITRIRQLTPEKAAVSLAWEHYHQRRRRVLDAAESVCGQNGYQLIEQTAPNRGDTAGLVEPFAGYDQLSTSPHARLELRRALGAQDRATLVRAVAYEQAKKRRKTMLDALEAALNVKRAVA